MKRFLLFAGDRFYANAAWCDFKGDFASVHDARDYANGLRMGDDPYWDWCQIVDTESMQIVHTEGGVYGRLSPE